jgi:ABC-type branched-subunit amino acid transport system ATPase component
VESILSLFPKLAERLKSQSRHLSGGEQQMLSIARALVGNPTLLMMDEPTEGLSPMLVQEVGRVIGELKAINLSTLLVEQNIRFAVGVADYVYVMSRGTIVHQCNAGELWQNTEVMSRYLGV